MGAQLQTLPEDMQPDGTAPTGWQLKKLTERHKSVCALLAQGLNRGMVATMCGITPEYVTMLLKQPLCMEYIKGLSTVAGVQLESLFPKTVEVISDVLTSGNATEKLKAVRLHGELTKRLGSGGLPPQTDVAADRFEKLAERLTGLLMQAKDRSARDAIEAEEGEFLEIRPGSEQRTGEAAQEDGPRLDSGIVSSDGSGEE